MSAIGSVEKLLWLLVSCCYLYQVYYIIYMILRRKEKQPENKNNKINKLGIIISARNEEAVIGHLLDSINNQTYPRDMIDVYVIADNCSPGDKTAEISESKGANVIVRNRPDLIGKGYALDYLFSTMDENLNGCAAFIVLDADNVLDKNYVAEMNKVFNKGYRVITSYRNSKNYGSNWISAGYSLWFMRESKYLNEARMDLNISCAISGTGFLVHSDIIKKAGGWKYFLLTEDIEFTIDNVMKGEKIGYAKNAVLYDEQPVKFSQSWRQRMRWAKGFYQVMGKYGGSLAYNAFIKRNFSCFDMLMVIFPAVILSIVCAFAFLLGIYDAIFVKSSLRILTYALVPNLAQLFVFYMFMYSIGLITTVSEWDNINCSTIKKLLYTFTFPIYLATQIPIAIVALFKKVEWKPITHSVVVTVDDITQN